MYVCLLYWPMRVLHCMMVLCRADEIREDVEDAVSRMKPWYVGGYVLHVHVHVYRYTVHVVRVYTCMHVYRRSRPDNKHFHVQCKYVVLGSNPSWVLIFFRTPSIAQCDVNDDYIM